MQEWGHLTDYDGRPEASDIARFLGQGWEYTRGLMGTDFYRTDPKTGDSIHLNFSLSDDRQGIDFTTYLRRGKENQLPLHLRLRGISTIELADKYAKQVVVETSGGQFRFHIDELKGYFTSQDQSVSQTLDFAPEFQQAL